jgi:hypothetical protein
VVTDQTQFVSNDLRTLRRFAELPLGTRLRRTCRGCGQPFIVDIVEALTFVTGPPEQTISCPLCGWAGVK